MADASIGNSLIWKLYKMFIVNCYFLFAEKNPRKQKYTQFIYTQYEALAMQVNGQLISRYMCMLSILLV